MAEPWRRAVRLPLGRARPAAARLRSRRAGAPALNGKNGWPEVDAIAITHFHLDHWGDLVPWVWGPMWGLGQEYEPPELWLPPGGREELAAFGTRFGTPDMFIRVFEPKEYTEGEEFEAAGLKLWRLGSRTTPCRRSASASRTAPGRSPTPATRARASDSPGWPRVSTSSSARRPSSGASWTASHADTSRPRRPWPRSRLRGKRLLLTHRPKELPPGRRSRAGPRRARVGRLVACRRKSSNNFGAVPHVIALVTPHRRSRRGVELLSPPRSGGRSRPFSRRPKTGRFAPPEPDFSERVTHFAHRHVLA